MRAGYRQLEAAATPAREAISHMPDQIIDAVMARSIHTDAVRRHPLAAWVVAQDQIDYPGELVARLVTSTPTSYVLRGSSLVELHAQLPPGLQRFGRQPSDPPEVVEVWLPA